MSLKRVIIVWMVFSLALMQFLNHLFITRNLGLGGSLSMSLNNVSCQQGSRKMKYNTNNSAKTWDILGKKEAEFSQQHMQWLAFGFPLFKAFCNHLACLVLGMSCTLAALLASRMFWYHCKLAVETSNWPGREGGKSHASLKWLNSIVDTQRACWPLSVTEPVSMRGEPLPALSGECKTTVYTVTWLLGNHDNQKFVTKIPVHLVTKLCRRQS